MPSNILYSDWDKYFEWWICGDTDCTEQGVVMDEEVGGHHDVMLPYHHDAHTGHDHHEEVGHHHDVCHLVLVDEAAVVLIVEPERPLQLLLRGL